LNTIGDGILFFLPIPFLELENMIFLDENLGYSWRCFDVPIVLAKLSNNSKAGFRKIIAKQL
jgi:hypothetical protein